MKAQNRYKGARGKSRQTNNARAAAMCGGQVRRMTAVVRNDVGHATPEDVAAYLAGRDGKQQGARNESR